MSVACCDVVLNLFSTAARLHGSTLHDYCNEASCSTLCTDYLFVCQEKDKSND